MLVALATSLVWTAAVAVAFECEIAAAALLGAAVIVAKCL